MSVDEDQSLSLIPHPTVASSRLQGLSLLSLHFTLEGSLGRYEALGSLGKLGKLGADNWGPEYCEALVAPLSPHFAGPLHLLLEGALSPTLQSLLSFVTTRTTVFLFSLGTVETTPLSYTGHLQNFLNVATSSTLARRCKKIELFYSADGYSSFHPSPIIPLPSNAVELRARHASASAAHGSFLPSPPNFASTDDTQNLQYPYMHQLGPGFLPHERVAFTSPAELYDTWKDWHHSALLITNFRSLQISGGHWKLAERTDAPYLRRLSCQNIWTLLCSQVQCKLPRLVSFELSFCPEGILREDSAMKASRGELQQTFKWGNIARFLTIMLVPTIQIVSISFPAPIKERVQRAVVDNAWKEKVKEMHQLKEVTLCNYIPSTLSAICNNDNCRRSIEKLVLIDDTLPQDFTTTFIPKNLPSLNHLDISKVIIERGAAANEVLQSWISKWQEAGIKTFLPPLEESQPSPAYRRVNL